MNLNIGCAVLTMAFAVLGIIGAIASHNAVAAWWAASAGCWAFSSAINSYRLKLNEG